MKTALVSLSLIVLLGGCSATPAQPTATPSANPTSGPSESPSSTPSSTPSPSPSPSATSASPSKVPAPAAVSFTETATYADGLKVEVIKTKHTKLSAEGGEDTNLAIGAPILVLSIRVTNGTGARINLEDSDGLVTFAGKKHEATNVDDVSTNILYGHLAAGAAKTGKYGFVEPKKQPDGGSLEFTVDAHHGPAKFKGDFR